MDNEMNTETVARMLATYTAQFSAAGLPDTTLKQARLPRNGCP